MYYMCRLENFAFLLPFAVTVLSMGAAVHHSNEDFFVVDTGRVGEEEGEGPVEVWLFHPSDVSLFCWNL